MKRINVIGTSGSGKSTFSSKVAEILDVPHIELDALFWQPDWAVTADEEFFPKIESRLVETDGWVLDGNYSRTTSLKWRYADTVIWLDYSFARTTYQVTKRALWRAWSQTEIWPGTGNTESWRKLLSKDGIIWWSVSSYKRVKARYETAFKSDDYSHITFVRLRSPDESERFLKSIAK